MKDINFEYDIGQWLKLTDSERINIINNLWDPYNPTIGHKIKREIANEFISKTRISARQFGLKSFGWTVYMLFVVVDNSRERVPSKFLGLSVNKGIIISNVVDNKAMVKFNYGGTVEIDLTERISIR
jgi:hypothetical protein